MEEYNDTEAGYLAEAKNAALANWPLDYDKAVIDMLARMRAHPSFRRCAENLTMYGLYCVAAGDVPACRRFIEGFRW